MSVTRGTITTADQRYVVALDFLAGTNPIYIGIAEPGTATNVAGWQIRKLTYDLSGNPTNIQYATGSASFQSVWDNRASLSYS